MTSARRLGRNRSASGLGAMASRRDAFISVCSSVHPLEWLGSGDRTTSYRLQIPSSRAIDSGPIMQALKVGIFQSRKADQRDGAVLHIGQESVLLKPVETVDLVDEQQRALPRGPHRIMEASRRDAIIRPSGPSDFSRCSCPTNPSMLRGRSRSANGRGAPASNRPPVPPESPRLLMACSDQTLSESPRRSAGSTGAAGTGSCRWA